jgi:hypothetical protein
MTPIDSIPHASSAGNNKSNGQQLLSISPTNSTSPVNKESSLANDDNTRVPEYDPGSGEETADTTTRETTEDDKTGQGQEPAR